MFPLTLLSLLSPIKNDTMKSIIICGTGRCGTTITKRVLSSHPKLFSFKYESLFLSYPYGLVSLFKGLTEGWTPFCSDAAIRNCEKFILGRKSKILYFFYERLVKFQSNRSAFCLVSPPPYMSFNLREHRDIVSKYFEILKKDLQTISYDGAWPGYPGFIFKPKMNVPTIVDEQKVAGAINKFISCVFGELMVATGTEVWLDDSIYAYLLAKDVLKILPEAKFIHMTRDPRDVISSYAKRLWAPSCPIKAAKMYRATMEKWEIVRQQIPEDVVLDVKFEDLVENQDENFKRICSFIGIDYDGSYMKIDKRKANLGRWNNDLSQRDLANIEPIIGKYLSTK